MPWLTWVAAHPDGEALAVGDGDGRLRVWSPATGRVTARQNLGARSEDAVRSPSIQLPSSNEPRMVLRFAGELVGSLDRYGYETPWATARIAPVDAEMWARLCRASHFLRVEIEENDLDDDAYDLRLKELGLTEQDLERLSSSAWSVESTGDLPSGWVDIHECDDKGWVTWRWAPDRRPTGPDIAP